MKAIVVHALLLSGKNGFACYLLLSVAFIFMMPLTFFRLFGRLYPVLSGQMPSHHVWLYLLSFAVCRLHLYDVPYPLKAFWEAVPCFEW
jgi:hypothetical protein